MTPQAVERLLYLTMEGEVIRSLLSGNDTQCFTTEQFEDAKDAWIAGVTGSTREQMGLGRPPREIARRQLLAMPLVTEVGPDVWALREAGHA